MKCKNILILVLSCILIINTTACGSKSTNNIGSNNYLYTNNGDMVNNLNKAVNLYQHIQQNNPEDNIIISPLSINIALAMLANGANSETLKQIEKAISSGSTINSLNTYYTSIIEKVNKVYTPMTIEEYNKFYYNYNLDNPDEEKKLKEAYNKYLENANKIKLEIANSLWINDVDDIEIIEDTVKLINDKYKAEIIHKEFDGNTYKEVNDWVSEKTHELIKEILTSSNINNNTRAVLINTVYFNDYWITSFNKNSTELRDFNINKNTKTQVMTMKSDFYEKDFEYFENNQAKAMSKSYSNAKFYAILPNEDLMDSNGNYDISKIDLEDLFKSKLSCDILTIQMPKFDIEYKISLVNTLKSLGILDVFDPVKADLSKLIIPKNPDANIYLSDTLHKTRVKLDEERTEAAAATAMVIGMETAAASSTPPPKIHREIILDRPFYFAIVDNTTREVLFFGDISDLSE